MSRGGYNPDQYQYAHGRGLSCRQVQTVNNLSCFTALCVCASSRACSTALHTVCLCPLACLTALQPSARHSQSKTRRTCPFSRYSRAKASPAPLISGSSFTDRRKHPRARSRSPPTPWYQCPSHSNAFSNTTDRTGRGGGYFQWQLRFDPASPSG